MPEPHSQNQGIFDFIRVAFKDFMHTGTLFPSSRAASQQIANRIPDADNIHVVEYGSGNGLLSRVILEGLKPNSHLYAVEINLEFIEHLKQIPDKRLHVINADVTHISSHLQTLCPDGVDAVVSGIPFSFLSIEQRETIVANTYAALRPGGVFVVYQNSPMMLSLLREHFSSVTWSIEPRNLPPYFIMTAKKE